MATPFDSPEGPMPFLGVRVHRTQAEILARLAAAGTSRSSVVREALDAYFARLQEATAPAHEAARLATENFQAQAERANAIGRAATENFQAQARMVDSIVREATTEEASRAS